MTRDNEVTKPNVLPRMFLNNSKQGTWAGEGQTLFSPSVLLLLTKIRNQFTASHEGSFARRHQHSPCRTGFRPSGEQQVDFSSQLLQAHSYWEEMVWITSLFSLLSSRQLIPIYTYNQYEQNETTMLVTKTLFSLHFCQTWPRNTLMQLSPQEAATTCMKG